MNLYQDIVRPALFTLDAERAHGIVSGAAKHLQRSEVARSMLRSQYLVDDPRLAVSVGGVNWRNPVGLAAGFDKTGALPPFFEALGFGCIEIGTFTQHAQLGNPTPRLFRILEDEALVNRMGFNNRI